MNAFVAIGLCLYLLAFDRYMTRIARALERIASEMEKKRS
jgi:hypothetical protein